jgi:xylulokinase
MDNLISLGTSTTLLLTTNKYKPSPSYHIFNHPTTPGLYMVMLCYKNGSLARGQIRDHLPPSKDWSEFNSLVLNSPILGGTPPKIGFYFPLPEIIPEAPSGTTRFLLTGHGPEITSWAETLDPRLIIESQALSMRFRSHDLVDGKPRNLYFVGGAAANTAIVTVMATVVGRKDGVFRLNEGVTAGACARGSAIKAAWAYDGHSLPIEEFIRERWNTKDKLERLDIPSDDAIWELYGSILPDYKTCEQIILETSN